MIQLPNSFHRFFTSVPMGFFGVRRLAGSDATAIAFFDRTLPEDTVRDRHPLPVPRSLPANLTPPAAEEARQVTVSVVIPHLNEPVQLARCLRSLDRQRKGRVPLEIIVVDNGSREPVADICLAFPGVRHVVELVPGPGPARNRGAAIARGEIIAFIDADCVAHDGWAEAIEDAFRTPSVDILGGDIRILPRSAQRTALEAYEGLYSYRARLFVERHGYAATGNMAVRAEVFRRVGPFAGLGTHEDVVWGRKAKALGCAIVYRPSVTVSTDACDSFKALAKRLDRLVVHSRSDTWPHGRLRWGLRTCLILASPLPELARILTSDRLTGARERFAVFALLVRTRLHRAKRMASLWYSGNGVELLMTWNRE